MDKRPSTLYADTVADLFAQGYDLTEVTTAAVVHHAMERWIGEQMVQAYTHHRAVSDRCGCTDETKCDGWYALANATTQMHAALHGFVHALLDPMVKDSSDV